MRIDSLERLIATADFSSFRDIVHLYLSTRGYADYAHTDGWNDGGSDVSFYLQNQRSPVAIQLSVNRRWNAKLIADIGRIKERYPKFKSLLFFTPYRVPEPDFHDFADDIQTRFQISVRKVDNQALASEFLRQGAIRQIFRILGIDIDAGETVRRIPADAKQQAAYSLLLFGDTSRDFRQTTLETIVEFGLVAQGGRMHRAELVINVASELGLAVTQRDEISGAIDRLLQNGTLGYDRESQELLAPDALVNQFDAADILCNVEWSELAAMVADKLRDAEVIDDVARPAAESIMERAGALCMTTARGLSSVLASQRTSSTLNEDLSKRVREIDAVLDTIGIDDSDRRESLLGDIAEAILESSFSRHLIAGEMFLGLLKLNSWSLARALGDSDNLAIWLDASVVIPVIATSLYEAVGQQYFVASARLWELLASHDLKVEVPPEYCEEAATHMIDAYRTYRQLLDMDEDLSFSTNAYVAHYSSLKSKVGYDKSFEEYLAGYGVTHQVLTSEFSLARSNVQGTIRRLLNRLGIEIANTLRSSPASRKNAEVALTYGLSQLSQNRAPMPLKHDANVIASLMDRDRSAMGTIVLCTWDRIHLYVYEHEPAYDWHVMDPAVLGDVMAMVRPEESAEGSVTAWSIAMSLLNHEAERGAALWDQLVRIDEEIKYDADAIRDAREFKDSYLKGRAGRVRPDDVATAWEAWRTASGK